MSLKLIKRDGSPYWWIRGTVAGVRIKESTGTGDKALAEEKRALREADLHKRSIYGDEVSRTFGEAALSYMEAGGDPTHLPPLIKRFGTTPLAKIGQGEIEDAAKALKKGCTSATINRQIFTPMGAVLHHAARKRWCAKPVLARPKEPEGRVRWLTHAEADRLIANAGHLVPLVTFLFCTGARISEALGLDWRDVDLTTGHISILNETAGGKSGTKNNKSRGVPLHPKAVAALANLPHREGAVFRTHDGDGQRGSVKYSKKKIGEPYASRDGQGGGQVKKAWAVMLKKAGITDFTPHDCRHTWATWHYSANRDFSALMTLGGWADIKSVLRYAHVNVNHLALSIATIWGDQSGAPGPNLAQKVVPIATQPLARKA